MIQTQVKTYTKPEQYQHEASRMSRDGWRVVSTEEHAPRTGCMRWLIMGPLVLIFRPKHKIVVTYERTTPQG